ncbi:CaiB/BaiF CoA transferase family protein [Sphingomonas mali]|uniref:CaiB/BaiF CoA transferase family protein n=1 Tax=Sphingomonas mali TaxID=40682 RepID=UPI0008307BD7|nr:CoA transferase [Sphingomonas mali]
MTGLPLSDLVVLDLTLARAGPTAVRHLADWGAAVVRIEPVTRDGDEHRDMPDFQNLHRNKRTIRLDLKAPDGLALFRRLIETADVLVENMRSSVKHRLGIAWEDVRAINPRLVYGSISGFGQTGPYADRPALDQIAQGMSGLMSITGTPGGGPMRVGIDIADLTAGNLLALGIMMGLHERARTGEGRWVQTSLLEGALFMLDFQAARWLMQGDLPDQAGNDHPIHIPAGVYPASDGHITIAASSPRLWPRFCEAMARADWIERPDWATLAGRSAARLAINAAIAKVTIAEPARHWIERLTAAGIPCGPINSIAEAFADPQVRHLAMATPVDHPRHGVEWLVASPIGFADLPRCIRSATRDAGADTMAVLGELGIDSAEIERLCAAGIVS